ncbi:nitroreductase family protein [Aldersonia sp. NBC_00410]|uniref:nitroreductase family protein n=1 Tax=Aldersonia sp. NBC_00410 TaxID=2975954 RepID=UPI00225BA44D|nr:nitroreductase family protein [Aldersonia sp. NBC_00410]MCX5046091.1 nitroreductase family protein [Aldersonia sp. NBC_00410]
MDFDEVATTTRAVRKRLDLDRPVEPELINECLRIATQAPTGSNSQGWRFVVVTDPDKRKGLADCYRVGWNGSYRGGDAATGRASDDQAQQTRVRSSAQYLADNMERVPVLVVPCLVGRPVADSTAAWAGFLGSIIPAVWSFQLALRSRGLGSAYTTLHLADEAKAAQLLGLPDTVTQVALIPVAYTIGTDFKPAVRRPVEEITYWNGWKATR